MKKGHLIGMSIVALFMIVTATNAKNNKNKIDKEQPNEKLSHINRNVPSIDKYISSWGEFRDEVENKDSSSVFAISNDLLNGAIGSVEVNRDITVDLNGKKLDIGLSNEKNGYLNGSVFRIQNNATLTIYDSKGDGVMTGGFAYQGGGIYIGEGSTCIIHGGNINNNRANGDNAAYGGGGIYVAGTLIMDGGTITDNKSYRDGGGIYVASTGSAEISNVNIIGNQTFSNYWGGGIFNKGTLTIDNCTFIDNVASQNGGAIANVDKKAITINNSTFTNNRSSKNGGTLFLDSNDARIYSSNIDGYGDDTNEKGGIIFNYTNLYISDSTLFGGRAKNGGGIYTTDQSDLTLVNATMYDNVANEKGGAVFADAGTVTLNGGSIYNNKALSSDNGYGGAFYIANVTMKFYAGSINNNTAGYLGGGIYLSTDASTSLEVKESPYVYRNEAVRGDDIYQNSDDIKIEVTGKLNNEACISVATINNTGNFASGYDSEINGDNPANFFKSTDGLNVKLLDGGVLSLTTDRQPKYANSAPFIPYIDDIVADEVDLNGRNWMSGISGDRRINEINIPGTHDSAMKATFDLNDSFGSWFNHAGDAITQYLRIPDQIYAGSRILDLRCNLRSPKVNGSLVFEKYYDDGRNLWLCHGKNSNGGTFWAKDYDGTAVSLNETLDAVINFLTLHPSETIIICCAQETWFTGAFGLLEDDIKPIYRRIKDILYSYYKRTNPSTNKSYIYAEDGVFGKIYTDYPKLKDVRGQIVLACDPEPDPKKPVGTTSYGGILDKTMGGKYHRYKPEGNYKDSASEKIVNLRKFFKTHIDYLPTDTTTSLDVIYEVGTNCTDPNWIGVGSDTPINLAKPVLASIFDGGNNIFAEKGRYFGWIKTDGANGEHFRKVWKSNFFDNLKECTITVKANIPDFIDQTYTVLKGHQITLPEKTYTYDEYEHNNFFMGWRIGDTLYHSGDVITINENVTVNAVWEQDPKTTVQVVWQDANNLDNLRGTVYICPNGRNEYRTELNAGNNYFSEVTTLISSVVMEGDCIDNDHVNYPRGVDRTGNNPSYRFEVSGSQGQGFTITMIHTPDVEWYTSGEVRWVDDGNYDSVRPTELDLYLQINGVIQPNSVRVTDSDWSYSFSDNLYEDGKPREFQVVPSEVFSYYYEYDGDDIVFTHTANYIDGYINWIDGNNISNERPSQIKVGLYIGEETSPSISTMAKGDEQGNWIWNIRYPSDVILADFHIGIDTDETPIDGYTYSISGSNIYNINILKDGYDKAATIIDLINSIGEVSYNDNVYKKINGARAAYNLLPSDEKALVSNLETLENAEVRYTNLSQAYSWAKSFMSENCSNNKEDWDIYKAAYQSLNSEAKEIIVNMAHVDHLVVLEDQLELAIQRYDYVIQTYGTGQYEDYIGRISAIPDLQLSANIASLESGNSTVVILIAVASLSLISISILIRKRKTKKLG
ncbi:MAG: Cna B-type domain-containing protein [Bacilli bacterium]|nr:Cna B-type domain-containing protein [Bacilli bacterium]